MNASKMRRDGRSAFCPEDTPEEYLSRVGRNLYGYGLDCFKQGWDEEASTYEEQQDSPDEKPVFTIYLPVDIEGNVDYEYISYMLTDIPEDGSIHDLIDGWGWEQFIVTQTGGESI
jgi:hypothetical protein